MALLTFFWKAFQGLSYDFCATEAEKDVDVNQNETPCCAAAVQGWSEMRAPQWVATRHRFQQGNKTSFDDVLNMQCQYLLGREEFPPPSDFKQINNFDGEIRYCRVFFY